MNPMVLLSDEGQVEPGSVRLEIVPILTPDRCTVCTEGTTVSNIVLDKLNGTRKLHGSCGISFLVRLETVLVSVQDSARFALNIP
jgi:hypothetical protein